MKNTSVSLFRQVLDLIPKREFEEIVMKHNGDKHKQTFDCWAHFVSMIFCQLAQANSLREICGGLKTCGGKLNHLGDCASTTSSLTSSSFTQMPDITVTTMNATIRDTSRCSFRTCGTMLLHFAYNRRSRLSQLLSYLLKRHSYLKTMFNSQAIRFC